MSDLDDKLREILTRCRKMEITEDAQVAQIHQAFSDAGYVQAVDAFNSPKLSGQQWYDRFEKEVNELNVGNTTRNDYLYLAKRAAGLSNET